MTVTTAILPELFPLSKSMVARLSEDRDLATSIPLSSTTSLEELERQLALARERFEEMWTPLLHEVEALRERACDILPPLEQGRISTEHFLHVLQKYTPQKEAVPNEAFTIKTISRWRGRGLVRYDQRDCVNYETAIAVLMMRLADRRRERGFLPPGDHLNEPYMYVWRQDSPESAPVPCGLPLSEDVPRSALLYSRWRALGRLSPGWLSFGDLGSIRWCGVCGQENGNLLWDLSEQDLMQWDPSVLPLSHGVLDSVVRLTRHTLATLVLLKQASSLFERQPMV